MKYDFGGRLRPKEEEPSWENLVDLSNEGMAFVYQRLSSHEQVRRSIYSIKAQDALEDLAKEDGYRDEQIYVEQRDLGISGTKGREERKGLAYLIEQVEAGRVEAVYVVHISRLYRDQTLINALSLGELFKEHKVVIVTPQMRLNLRDRMHMRMYRMEVERAADELELMANRLLGARELKARSGLYTGESIPTGYVVDEREKLDDGSPNPDYHGYKIYEPHAEVVRIIFQQLAIPGMTLTRVARQCKRKGIVLAPFPKDLDTPVNRKTSVNSKCNPDGSWPVTVYRVQTIATNPAYIGWKVWSGEVVGKDVYPPIVDEQLFWVVQERFNGKESRPKKEYDPLPLAGLLYCGKHTPPRRMSYSQYESGRNYRCLERAYGKHCLCITADHLDGPISEAVMETLELSEIAEDVLDEIATEYEAAKEQAASYRREMRRLEAEVESLRENLVKGPMSADQLKWLDDQIQDRLDRVRELADLESQPVGAAVGKSVPDKEDVEIVRELLETLEERWDETPNGLKNAFLRLTLDKVIIWHKPATIQAKLIWRSGEERELLIHRTRKKKRYPWTEEEIEVLREHYETADKNELAQMLLDRSWEAIRMKGYRLGLTREDRTGKSADGQPYTQAEDELIRRYYRGEITQDEALEIGRTATAIKNRANRLGLEWEARKVRWEWLKDVKLQSESPSGPGGSI